MDESIIQKRQKHEGIPRINGPIQIVLLEKGMFKMLDRNGNFTRYLHEISTTLNSSLKSNKFAS